jgi:glycosyltransferase involved in cell wall biosynthesis
MRRESELTGEKPVRLVQFTKGFWIGGTEVQVVELLRGLPGHYQVQVSVLEDKGPLLEEVWKLGHIPKAFSLGGSFARPNTLLQIGRLAAWLREHRAEVLHVHDFYATLIAVPAAKLAGCRVIVGRLDLAHWHGKARRALLMLLTQAADHVIANADAIKEMLIREERIAPEKISVIRNGLDLPRFDRRRAEGLKAPLPEVKGPVVVHVANMTHPVKRQEDLIDAIALLARDGRRLDAFLVGDGVRKPALQEKARALGVADRVHFLGHRHDVPAIYSHATMGVLCSSAEGLSNAVMEGMAAGLPMVVTSVGGNPELVEDGVRGHVVPPRQPAELAKAFARVLDAPEQAAEMGRKARTFVERELSLRKMVAEHDALYRRLAKRE